MLRSLTKQFYQLNFNIPYKNRVYKNRFIVHWTPDISGGVATKIFMTVKALSDYFHAIFCRRKGPNRPAKLFSDLKICCIVPFIEHNKVVSFINKNFPIAVFNYNFWDLIPITKKFLKKDIPVFNFLCADDVYLNYSLEDVDKIVVPSKFYKEIFKNIDKWEENKTVIMNQGLDVSNFLPKKKVFKEWPVIGNITNGAVWKHSKDFLDLCREIKKNIPEVRFEFLGAKDLQDKVKVIHTLKSTYLTK